MNISIKKYIKSILAVNLTVLVLTGVAFTSLYSDVSTKSRKSKLEMAEANKIALTEGKIQSLTDFTEGIGNFNSDLIESGLNHEDYSDLFYSKTDGRYINFDNLITSDGSVTYSISKLDNAGKSELYMDVVSLLTTKHNDISTDSVEYQSIVVYKEYLSKQLSLNLSDLVVLDKYVGNGAITKSDRTESLCLGVSFIVMTLTIIAFTVFNSIVLALGVHFCKDNEDVNTEEVKSESEETDNNTENNN